MKIGFYLASLYLRNSHMNVSMHTSNTLIDAIINDAHSISNIYNQQSWILRWRHSFANGNNYFVKIIW